MSFDPNYTLKPHRRNNLSPRILSDCVSKYKLRKNGKNSPANSPSKDDVSDSVADFEVTFVIDKHCLTNFEEITSRFQLRASYVKTEEPGTMELM